MARTPIDRVRQLVAELPETSETVSHGAPTFWGGKKTFAIFHAGAYDEGRRAVWIKAEPGAQEALIESDPDRFYRPKYVGPSGWVGVRLEGKVDWDAVRALLEDGFRMVAPKRALAVLDGGKKPTKKPRKEPGPDAGGRKASRSRSR